MEIDSAIPPVAIRLNTTIREYVFRLAKLSPNHSVNLWAINKTSLRPNLIRPIQLERISRSILGLVDKASLERLSYFKFTPWNKTIPYGVNIAKLSKDD
jgi:hypothetical protein